MWRLYSARITTRFVFVPGRRIRFRIGWTLAPHHVFTSSILPFFPCFILHSTSLKVQFKLKFKSILNEEGNETNPYLYHYSILIAHNGQIPLISKDSIVEFVFTCSTNTPITPVPG